VIEPFAREPTYGPGGGLARFVAATLMALSICGRFDGIEVHRDRRFRVDHQVARARHADNHIRAEAAVRPLEGFLGRKVAVGAKA